MREQSKTTMALASDAIGCRWRLETNPSATVSRWASTPRLFHRKLLQKNHARRQASRIG